MLEIRDLHVKFHTRDREAVSGVSLTIQNGEILGLVGESGSGKSVTAMSVAGLLPRRRKLDPVPRPGRRASGTESDRRHMKNAPSRAADWTMHESPRAPARGLSP